MRTGVLIRPVTVAWARPRVVPEGGISEPANQSPELQLVGLTARITATATRLFTSSRWREGGRGEGAETEGGGRSRGE